MFTLGYPFFDNIYSGTAYFYSSIHHTAAYINRDLGTTHEIHFNTGLLSTKLSNFSRG
jgi:hypothetical protein